jgi:hypothetical protein
MKINEITEQPVSGIKTGLQGLGSRVLNRIPGMKGRAANLAARADHGDTARNAYNAFAKWLGDRNKKINQATGDDLKSFFDDAGLDSSSIEPGPIDKKSLNAAMLDAATQTKSKSKKTSLPKSRSATVSKPQQSKAAKKKSQGQDRRATDSYEKAKSNMRVLASPQGKPLPDEMLQRLAVDIRKLSKGDKESGVYAADKILKFAKAGRDVSGMQKRWLQSAKAGERFLTQSVYRFVSNLLTEHNLSWSDLGLQIRLTESRNQKNFILISKI